jgi:hypothetical protein
MIHDLIYLLNETGLPPGDSSTVHIYTQTIHKMIQNKYIEQHKNFGRARAVPLLCRVYPGICLTTEEKAQKNLSWGSRRVTAGTMKIHKHTIRRTCEQCKHSKQADSKLLTPMNMFIIPLNRVAEWRKTQPYL